MYSTGIVIIQQVSLKHNAIAVPVLVTEHKKKWDSSVIEVGILTAISRIVSQNNKDKMVVLSNQKQVSAIITMSGKIWVTERERRLDSWWDTEWEMLWIVSMWVNFKIIPSFFNFFKICCSNKNIFVGFMT